MYHDFGGDHSSRCYLPGVLSPRLNLEGLNPRQREAVLHEDGPLVVFAGAGSGKTRVITYRIAHCVIARNVPPWRILAVTFTNKAAGEMRERVGQLVPDGARELHVGTFHSMCARLLRRHAERMGVRRDFTIYDDQDQQAMVKRVLRDLSIDEKRFAPKTIAACINRAKQEVQRPDAMDASDVFQETAQRVYVAYEEAMQRAGALDFGDLIARPVMTLEADEAFRNELAGKYKHLLVDEFQDTNHAQFRLVRALGSVHQNLCVVGDDDQAIYRWRGADRRHILDFQRSFPSAAIYKLEQNYRSTKRILRVAHSIIAKNADREPKQLWTDNDEGTPPLIVRTEDERDEANMVVRAVQELITRGEALADAAVFYRIHAQSRALEVALRAANIPYRIVGGVRFYDRAEVKDVLAYLRLLHNPDDDVSVLRVLNKPARGIGKTTVERLMNAAARSGRGIWNTIERAGQEHALKGAALKKVCSFAELVKELQKLSSGPVSELCAAVLERTGYLSQLQQDNSAESDARVQNLQELHGSMLAYEQEADSPSLANFLEDVTLQTDVAEDDAPDQLTLMTVHAAKGLEFDTVLVTGLEERMFPFKGFDPWDDPDEIEEERRLAYVAFTRARQQLILSYASLRRVFGQARPGIPSRFIEELPADDVTWLGARPSTRGYTPAWSSSSRQETESRTSSHERERDNGQSYIDRCEGSDLSDDPAALFEGMHVRHPKFGVGQVQGVVGGAPARAKVRFERAGVRTIVARFLQPI